MKRWPAQRDRDRPRPQRVRELGAAAADPARTGRPGRRRRGRYGGAGGRAAAPTTGPAPGPVATPGRSCPPPSSPWCLSCSRSPPTSACLAVLAVIPLLLALGLGVDRARSLGHALVGELAGRPLRQPDPQARAARDRRDHRLERPEHLVPAPRRPGHPRRHHRRRQPVGHRPRRTLPRGRGPRPRRRPRPPRAVHRARRQWSRRPTAEHVGRADRAARRGESSHPYVVRHGLDSRSLRSLLDQLGRGLDSRPLLDHMTQQSPRSTLRQLSLPHPGRSRRRCRRRRRAGRRGWCR